MAKHPSQKTGGRLGKEPPEGDLASGFGLDEEIDGSRDAWLDGDVPAARAVLIALKELGIRISLDDFGTGYSNLRNLRDLRFDKIKIDRSFVLSMETNVESAKIVRSVITLAQSLGLPTVAEGIEHRDALADIVESGGDYGQGYYFAKAMSAAEAANLVEGAPDHDWTRRED